MVRAWSRTRKRAKRSFEKVSYIKYQYDWINYYFYNMKFKTYFLIYFLLGVTAASAQNIIPAIFQNNTFNLIYQKNAGTCFLLGNNNKNYLITARHLFDKFNKNGDTINIELLNTTGNDKLKCVLLIHKNLEIDIAVLKILNMAYKASGFQLSEIAIMAGEDCFFFGFPYNINSQGSKIHNGFPFPLIKKATYSGVNRTNSGAVKYFLDGHNNPGFSGGPIITRDFSSNDLFQRWKLVGVISAYKYQENKSELKIDSSVYSISIRENSGIVIAYSQIHIKEILDINGE